MLAIGRARVSIALAGAARPTVLLGHTNKGNEASVRIPQACSSNSSAGSQNAKDTGDHDKKHEFAKQTLDMGVGNAKKKVFEGKGQKTDQLKDKIETTMNRVVHAAESFVPGHEEVTEQTARDELKASASSKLKKQQDQATS